MIDIWLIGGLLFPFFIIAVLVIMDSMVMKEKIQKRQERRKRRKEKRKKHGAADIFICGGKENEVIPSKNEEKSRLSSNKVLKYMVLFHPFNAQISLQ